MLIGHDAVQSLRHRASLLLIQPLRCKLAVFPIDFNAYSDSLRLKTCDQRCSAAEERVQYDLSLETEKFDASPGELDRKRCGMSNLSLALTAEVPHAVRPLNELVSSNVRFSFQHLVPAAFVHDKYGFDWSDHVRCGSAHP